MSAAAKLGIALGALALGGVALAAAASSPAPAAGGGSTPGVPPAGSRVWIRATQATQGQSVRISLSTAALAEIANAFGSTISVDLNGFGSLLANYAARLGTANFQAWGPLGAGGALPADWPADDTASAQEFHAQFVYGSDAPAGTLAPLQLAPQLFGVSTGLLAWVPKGTGA